ncbi:MAG: hypothetical protein QI223_01125 [Candidatus Korarchaeota archaeon]|nr:hypothetical protein [Candidatus Korarchaeota archaeon]
MSINEVASYLERLVRSASNSPYVEGVEVISRFIDRRGGYLRFRADFIDGSRLFAFEFVDARLRRLRYSYHYQDASGDLIFKCSMRLRELLRRRGGNRECKGLSAIGGLSWALPSAFQAQTRSPMSRTHQDEPSGLSPTLAPCRTQSS